MRGTQKWPAATGQPAAAPTVPIGDGPHSDGPELVGYARVSTRSQNDDTQLADLTAAGCARIFTDNGVSGKHASRPELDKCVAYLRPGDTFVITRLSRAMRSLRDLLDLANDLERRGINLVVIKQDIDTSTATGRLVFHILGAIDEWMRELIVEGTMEGLAVAKAKGRIGGKPRALSPEQEDLAMGAIQGGTPIAEVARSFGASRAALYRAARRRGILEEPTPGAKSGRPGISPEKTAEILRLLEEGNNIKATAEVTGVSHHAVRTVWKRSGARQPPPGLGKPRPGRGRGGRRDTVDEQEARTARRLLQDGGKIADVAQGLGVTRQALYRALDQLERKERGGAHAQLEQDMADKNSKEG